MEVEFDVRMKPGVLYDYMMHHTYTTLSGILSAAVGALLVVGGLALFRWIFVIAGAIVLLYQPWSLFLRSRQQMLQNPSFKKPIHYKLTETGIRVSQEQDETEPADDIENQQAAEAADPAPVDVDNQPAEDIEHQPTVADESNEPESESDSRSNNEIAVDLPWEDMYKAISTGSSIIVYSSRTTACIFPKKDLGDTKYKVIEMISTHMPPKKVKIRG